MSHESTKKTWGLFLFSYVHYNISNTMWLVYVDNQDHHAWRGIAFKYSREKAMYHASPKDQFIMYTYHLNWIRNIVITIKGEERDSKTFHGIGLRKRLICSLFIHESLLFGHSHTKKILCIRKWIANKRAINNITITSYHNVYDIE